MRVGHVLLLGYGHGMAIVASGVSALPATPAGQGIGPLLRAWRQRRGVSQPDLALRAGSSARHISIVETDVPAARFALPLGIEHDGQGLSFVSSISTFNTPMDVTVAELAIETLLPGDRQIPPVTVELSYRQRAHGPSPSVRPYKCLMTMTHCSPTLARGEAWRE